MSVTGDAVIWMDAVVSKIVMGSHVDRILEALFLYNGNITSIVLNVQADPHSTTQCTDTSNILTSFLMKASVRGCGGGRTSVPLYTISIIEGGKSVVTCVPNEEVGLNRRQEKRTSARLSSEASGINQQQTDINPDDQFNWRPLSDLEFTEPGIYPSGTKQSKNFWKLRTKTSNPEVLFRNIRIAKSKNRSGLKIRYDNAVIRVVSGTNHREGPIIRQEACGVGTTFEFGLRVPNHPGLNDRMNQVTAILSSYWGKTSSTPPAPIECPVFVATSPLLLRLRSSEAMTLANAKRDPETITLQRPEDKGRDDDSAIKPEYVIYKAKYTSKVPILGHLVLYFSLPEAVDQQWSGMLFDVSIVCGATSKPMQEKMNVLDAMDSDAMDTNAMDTDAMDTDAMDTDAMHTNSAVTAPLPFMTWNAANLGPRPGKIDFVREFAKKFEIGVWNEAKGPLRRALDINELKLKRVQDEFLITLSNYELSFETPDDDYVDNTEDNASYDEVDDDEDDDDKADDDKADDDKADDDEANDDEADDDEDETWPVSSATSVLTSTSGDCIPLDPDIYKLAKASENWKNVKWRPCATK
ncbi:hypothetical protein BDZ88DRAFT_83663 [Geranomyces variabilis]|nr:hypothetical protein BDZ88DRAFT_83663 [Geranomyces variabilis]